MDQNEYIRHLTYKATGAYPPRDNGIRLSGRRRADRAALLLVGYIVIGLALSAVGYFIG